MRLPLVEEKAFRGDMVEWRLTLLLLSLLLLLRLLLPLKGLTLYLCSRDGDRFFCGDFSFGDLVFLDASLERATLFVFAYTSILL